MMEGAALALAQARERGRAGFSLASAVGTIFFFFFWFSLVMCISKRGEGERGNFFARVLNGSSFVFFCGNHLPPSNYPPSSPPTLIHIYTNKERPITVSPRGYQKMTSPKSKTGGRERRSEREEEKDIQHPTLCPPGFSPS